MVGVGEGGGGTGVKIIGGLGPGSADVGVGVPTVRQPMINVPNSETSIIIVQKMMPRFIPGTPFRALTEDITWTHQPVTVTNRRSSCLPELYWTLRNRAADEFLPSVNMRRAPTSSGESLLYAMNCIVWDSLTESLLIQTQWASRFP